MKIKMKMTWQILSDFCKCQLYFFHWKFPKFYLFKRTTSYPNRNDNGIKSWRNFTIFKIITLFKESTFRQRSCIKIPSYSILDILKRITKLIFIFTQYKYCLFLNLIIINISSVGMAETKWFDNKIQSWLFLIICT